MRGLRKPSRELLECRCVLAAGAIDINQFSSKSSNPTEIVTVGELAYFVAEDQAFGREVWLTDGTPENTRPVSDVVPGPEGSFPTSPNGAIRRLW